MLAIWMIITNIIVEQFDQKDRDPTHTFPYPQSEIFT